jgi:hypothetical protein
MKFKKGSENNQHLNKSLLVSSKEIIKVSDYQK